MPRNWSDLSEEEQERSRDSVHREAEEAGWHRLSNQEKSVLYDKWVEKYDLKRVVLKDGLMKGFDARQGITKKGEAKIREEIEIIIREIVGYIKPNYRVWGGRGLADLAIGYSEEFITHIVEIEPVPNWRTGLSQATWYKSSYTYRTGRQVLPTLIVFGRATGGFFDQIRETCQDQGVLLLTYKLEVDGEEEKRHALKNIAKVLEDAP